MIRIVHTPPGNVPVNGPARRSAGPMTGKLVAFFLDLKLCLGTRTNIS